MNRKAIIQRLVALELPETEPTKAVLRDLAAWHSDQYARENGVGRIHRATMKRQVRERTVKDYESFRKDKSSIQTRVLPGTFELSRVPRGFLSSILAPLLIRWIVSAVTNLLIKLYTDRTRLSDILNNSIQREAHDEAAH